MGFFSEIANEVRRNDRANRPDMSQRPGPAPSPFPAPVQAIPETQAPAGPVSVPAVPEPVSEQLKPDPVPEAVPEEKPTPAQAIDLTDHTSDEAERRKAHEDAEAKRKAAFDAKQAEKKAARQRQLDRIKAMNDAELLTAAVGRVAADTERLTRRNMKEAVAGHIQSKCRKDAAFAMLAMDPDKSMMNCFRYINRKARKYAEQEMKDQGAKRTGVYGLDVSDGLVYQWAEDYFNDPDAEEDHEGEEKFIPRPYVPAARKLSKPKAEKKKPGKKPKQASAELEQISLM